MELTQLKFVVDTSDLKNASAAIKALAEDVNRLNKPMQEAAKASSNLNKEQTKSAGTAKEVEATTKKQVSVLERQQMILEFMTQGFSKGQSSQLAYAKAAGAVTAEIEQLGKVLQTQRTLMGTDPFDKSLGAMQALKNEYTVIKEVQRLYNAELGLSKSQMEDLAREKLRLIEKFKLEGASLNDVKQGLRDLKTAYVQNANAENSITQSIRSRQKAIQDTAKAQDYVSREFERVNRLTADNGNLTSATNNKLIAMEKALRMSGMSAAEQTSKLEAYRKSLESIQKASGQRQVDYLSRALGPQITDIFVGLATGQSPMMVLLQQGGQLRDQFALAGVAGAQMGDMLVKASKAMVTSVKDIAFAVGDLLLKAILGVGSAIVGSLISPFKLLYTTMVGMASGTMTATAALEALKIATLNFAKTGIGAVLIGLGALLYEYVQVTKANTDLSQAIALTGASLGMSRNEAVAFAEALSQKTGTSTLKYIGILTEFAKAGATVDEGIIELASDMDKYLGQSIDKTAQQYAELSNEPTKALVKIAQQQGFVNEATLRQVYELEKLGRKTEAAAIAQKAYQESQRNALTDAKANLDTLQKLWIDVKSAISQASEAVYDLLKSGPVVATFRTAWETVYVVVSEVWYVLKQTGIEIGGIGAQIAAVMRGDFAGAKSIGEQMKIDADAARRSQDELVKSILDRNKAESQGSGIPSSVTKANSDAAKSFMDRMQLQKKSLDFFKQAMKEAGDFYLNQAGAVEHLTRAEVALNQVRQREEWKKLNETQQKQIASLYEAAAANERLKKAEEDRKSQLAYIASLNGQVDKMGSEYYSGLKTLDEALTDGNISLSEYIDLLNKLYKTTSSFKAFQGIESSVTKSITDINTQRASIQDQYGMDFRTDTEKTRLAAEAALRKDYADAQSTLDKNLADAKTKLNEAEYQKAVALYTKEADLKKQLAQDVYDRQVYLISDNYRRQEGYSKAFENLFSGMGDAIVNFAKTGKLNFTNLVDTMIADIIRLEMRMQTMQLYAALRPGIMNMIFGGGMTAQTSALTGGTGNAAGISYQAANGAAWSNGIQAFAKGGTFTNSIVSSPTLFKFAKGTGLMGEAGPEAIMPLTRDSSGKLGVQASGSGSNVSVQVINNTNAQATTNETVDSKGNRRIEVVIGDMTAGEISRSGSASQKSIKSTFGLQPQLIRR